MPITRPSLYAMAVIVLTLAGYPLVAGISEAMAIPNRPFSISMRSALLVFVFLMFVDRPQPTIKSSPKWFIAAFTGFWVLYLSRLAIDSIVDTGALQLPATEYFLFGVGTCLLPAIAMLCVRVEFFANRQTLIIACVFSGVALLLALWAIFIRDGVISSINLLSMRVETETLNPITIGHVGASLSILCIWLLVNPTRSGLPKLWSTFFIAGLALGLTSLLVSASRGPTLALAIAIFVLFATRPRLLLTPTGVLLVVSIAFIVFASTDTGEILAINRVAESSFKDDAREELLSAGLKVVMDHPIIGGGIEPLETYPHNLLLESFMVFGVMSGLLFTYLLISASIQAWRLMRVASELGWVSLLFFQYFAGAMVSSSLYGASAFWVLMTLVIALACRRRFPPHRTHYSPYRLSRPFA